MQVGQALALEAGAAGMIDETPDLWFVELASPPAAEGTAPATLAAEKTAFRRAAARAGLEVQERYAFSALFNGFSLRIDRSQISKLARVEGVKAIYPVETIAAPVGPVPGAGARPDLFASIGMIGANVVQDTLGHTGMGVRVAVMDTGIDLDHPDFGGSGIDDTTPFPSARVVAGYDFVGDAFNADSTSASYNPVPTPDLNPDDCGGHGSHVAGIIGANGLVKGVAPGVSFGAYRVFGCAGSTTADIMIAAMERALADGMQVLNMSIGSAYQWPEYPTAMAATRLVNKGTVVVASIGNNGPQGLWAAGAPGLGDKVIGVASYDNVAVTLPAFTISPDDTPFGYSAATGAPLPPTSGTYPMTRTGTTATTNDACTPLPAATLAGRIALIRRGTCSFYVKAWNAQVAGAVGVVLYNNAAGFLNPTVAGAPPITIPVVAITQGQGAVIDGRLASGPVTLTWTDDLSQVTSPTGGLISSFSSYGLSPDLQVKPDIAAPGGSIFSTYPIELGSYATMGGTSMASPHTAGAAALYLQAHPNTPSQAMGRLLQNTAVPKVWWGNPALGFLDQVSRQGAGMLQIDKAILATTKIEPGKLALGESQAGPVTRTLTIENDGAAAVTYDLSSVNALSVNSTYTPAAFVGNASVAFSSPSVMVAAGGTTTVDVTITPATSPDKAQYGGYIVFTPRGDGQVYRVPFAGFVGDYQSIQVLAPTANGFPWLAYLSGGSYHEVATSQTYSMTAGDIPYFLLHLDHQSALLRMEVYSESGKAWHRAFEERYLPRNSVATGFFAFPWDGTTVAGNRLYTVPDGRYVVKVSVLKALGDASNPAHWETWTSPVIVIDRP
jgi:subtilisin family serine protease